MDLESKIESFKRQGFVNAGPLALSPDESAQLVDLTRTVHEKLDPAHPHYLPNASGSGGLRALPEHDANITRLIEKVVSNPDVKRVLESVLGPDYKIWQIDLRRSTPGDRGLQLHQDSRGQVNISILLSESDGEGSTIYLPGSHLMPKRMLDMGVKVPPAVVNRLRSMFAPLAGKTGDIGFFMNRTWHGRFANSSGRTNDAILIGFFAPGGRMNLNPPYVAWSREFLDSVRGTELGRLADLTTGAEVQSDGFVKVVPTQRSAGLGVPFAMKIEDHGGDAEYSRAHRPRWSIPLLRIIGVGVGAGRALIRPFRGAPAASSLMGK